jgi:multidrug efflux pump subunit AcrA (membrane-fusion protein)
VGAKWRWTTIGLVIWVAAPLILIVALTLVSTGLSVAGTPQPAWVRAQSAGSTANRQVTLAITWSTAQTVLAPSWSGLVREVDVAAGDELRSGQVVARVDGTLRLAWNSPAPFYRPLGLGDSGDDVVALQALLQARSLPSGRAGTFDSTTKRGVQLLAKQLNASPASGQFSPDWVVYLPSAIFHISKVSLQVGAPPPSAGSVVLTGQRVPMAARLAATPGLPTDLSGAPTAENGETLEVGGMKIGLSNDHTVSADGLGSLSKVANSGDATVAGELVRDLKANAVTVPAAAVHSDAHGAACVRVRGKGSASTVAVNVLGGSGGAVVVSGGITPGEFVGVGAFKTVESCSS